VNWKHSELETENAEWDGDRVRWRHLLAPFIGATFDRFGPIFCYERVTKCKIGANN
jgi:hypothetical protein